MGEIVASTNKVEHWRSRAAEARATAEQMTHPEAKATMLSIAAGYERMARQEEKYEKALEALLRHRNPRTRRAEPRNVSSPVARGSTGIVPATGPSEGEP